MDLILSEDDVKKLVSARLGTPLLPFESVIPSIASIRGNNYYIHENCIIPLDQDIPWDHTDRTAAYKLQSFQPFAALLLTRSPKRQKAHADLAEKYLSNWLMHVRRPSENELQGLWEETQGKKDFLWYDMAVGLRAYRLGYMIDAKMRASEPDIPALIELIKIIDWHRQVLMSEAAFCDHNNHGLYQAMGQVAMARRFLDVPGMDKAMEQGNTRLKFMLDEQFFAEGVHKEHSPGYHWMLLRSMQEARRAGLMTNPEHIAALDKAEEAMAWLTQPNLRLPAFGDTDARGINIEETDISDFSSPHMRYVLSHGTTGRPPENPLKLFNESGYAVLKTYPKDGIVSSSYLAQHTGFHSRTHKHADHLTFVWHDKGEDILVDAGRYAYRGKTEPGSELWSEGFWYADPKRIHIETTRAHNTVEIDAQNYPRKNVKPYGSALKRSVSTGNGVYAIESECKHFKTIRHARTLFVKPGAFLIVYDWLKDNANETHDFRQWFHLGQNLDLKRDGNFLWATRGDEPFMAICPLLSGKTLDIIGRGQEEPELLGWVSHERGGTLEPNWAFSYLADKSPQAHMATLFTLNPDAAVGQDNEITPSGRTGTFHWHDKAGNHTLSFTRPSEGEIDLSYAMITE